MHTAVLQELHLGESNWKFVQVGYPMDTPTGQLHEAVRKRERESLSLNGLLKKAVGPCQLW